MTVQSAAGTSERPNGTLERVPAEAAGQSQAPAQPGLMGTLVERLEALSFTFEALNVGARTYAAEAVLETLSRMERRDLQSLAAVETFATALKSVSQHLAHLRQSVAVGANQTTAALDALSARLAQVEQKAGGKAPSMDMAPLNQALSVVAERLENLERSTNNTALAQTLNRVADRVARIETKVESTDQSTVNAQLDTILERLSRVEHKVDGGVEGPSIAACLLAVEARLSRIESNIGMERPAPEQPKEPAALPAPNPIPAILPQSTDAPQQAANTERVDQLLEQVFKVLAR